MPAMKFLDLNADLGEGGRHDAELLALVTSANIACGGHAGDAPTMRRTVGLALAAGVAIGAHPGYEDRENFGRRAMTLPLGEVTALVRRQVESLASIAAGMGAALRHVKPHGALYNQSVRDADLAAAIVRGVAGISTDLHLFALPGSALAGAGRAAGLTVRLEGFADRRYRDDGSLMPRGEPGAIILDLEPAVSQALALAASGRVQTLCIHGDGPLAVEMLRAIRPALAAAGVRTTT
jgi:UPF0271 protein